MTVLTSRDVRAGRLLAEGGEGRVHEVVGRPGVLYKAYRRPAPLSAVTPLLDWSEALGRDQPAMAGRLQAATSWPTDVVAEGDRATGLLLPRAPDRFSVRHRDGRPHLATLSYLTADPRQRSQAYGLDLPPPISVGRIALVYALARLLEAFAAGPGILGHGDLSTKNVLWSLRPSPAVYVIDCDGSRLYDGAGHPLDPARRQHVATPNWDDPAAALGPDPGPLSDRYSLALIFLRVVGAAHFPIQARQKKGERLTIDVEIPPYGRRSQRIGRGAEVWDLASRGLGVADPAARPSATEWREVLEATLGDLAAEELVAAVQRAQGDPPPTPEGPVRRPTFATPTGDRDVVVRGVLAAIRPGEWRASAPTPVPQSWRPPDPSSPAAGGQTAWRRPAGAAGVPLGANRGSGPSGRQQAARMARDAWRWWWALHQRMIRTLRTAGRRGQGVRRLVFCLVTDFVIASLGLFVLGVILGSLLGL